MAISRMNMERQLRNMGGLMTLEEPRQGYFLGKIVRKAKKAVKKVVKSPVGKAALLAGLGAYAGGLGPFAGGKFGAGFARPFFGGLKTGFLNPLMEGPMATRSGGIGRMIGSFIRNKPGTAALLGLGATAVAAPFFMGDDEEDIDEGVPVSGIQPMVADIRNQARQFYQDPASAAASGLFFMPQQRFVQQPFLAAGGGLADIPREGYDNGGDVMTDTEKAQKLIDLADYFMERGMSESEAYEAAAKQLYADGGRVGYRVGGGVMSMLQKASSAMKNLKNNIMTKLSRMTDDVEIQTSYDDAIDTGPSMDTMITAKSRKGKKVLDQLVDEGIAEFDDGVYYIKDFDDAMIGLQEGGIKASGAKLGSDKFTPTSQFETRPYESTEEALIRNLNKRAEGGIMDLGGMEKDYREGGFVPIGAEERADDVPARLSKNEFVFTADAVRNAGGGDIDEGAKVMQNMMDNQEAGGTISEESQGKENPAQAMFDQAQQLESRIV